MLNLVLSLDYEIFGNGSGDVRRDMIEPMRRLLAICDGHNARMTIMFEAAEYWAFEHYDHRLREDLGYSPAGEMREQVLDAVGRGHDVQLHLHPQWIEATYDQGRWRLQNSCWRLADLREGLGAKDRVCSIMGALHLGKQTLENIIKPMRPGYECICFRAGGFFAQPSEDIIAAMKNVGLRADSSVVKGYKTNVPFAVDYSHVTMEKTAWWTSSLEFTEGGMPGENILELAVSARVEPYWKNFKVAKVRAALQRRRAENASPVRHAESGRISSVPGYHTVLKKLWRKQASTFDFCKLSCRDMIKRMEEHAQDPNQPVVMIGHAKDFVNDKQFGRFLAWLSKSGIARSVTLSEYIRERIDSLPHLESQ